MDTITLNKDDSYTSSQQRLSENKHINGLQLEATPLDDKQWQDLIGSINEEMVSLTATHISISDKTLKIWLQKCRYIYHIKLVDCPGLSDTCITTIGDCLQHLRSIHIEYSHQSATWQTGVDVLSTLVRNCTSELSSISFIGFNSISDVGVCYAVECYTNSLTCLNLSCCPQVTDRALMGVADWSKLLIYINVNGTSVSDKGVIRLTSKCKKLQHVDIGNCTKVSDKSIKILADFTSANLEVLNVENCMRLTDISLTAVIYNCHRLKLLQYSGTSVTFIPPHILALRRLKSVQFTNCVKLSREKMGDINGDISLQQLGDLYKGYNVPYRLRVFFLGDEGCGKSSLIQSLRLGEPTKCKHPTLGINVFLWSPLKQQQQREHGKKYRTDECNILMECYDVSGSKLLEGIPPVFFTSESLYVIVFNPTKSGSVKSVVKYTKTIQAKAPGSRILVIGTHRELITADNEVTIRQEVLQSVADAEKHWCKNISKEIENIRELSCDLKFQSKIEELEAFLELRPRISSDIPIVSCVDGKNLSCAYESLLSVALDYKQFQHLGRSLKLITVEALQHIYRLREQGQLLPDWESLCATIIKPDGLITTIQDLDPVIRLLHNVGLVLDIHFLEYVGAKEIHHRLICSNPPMLAEIMCSLHLDLKSSNEKLNIKRFWPKGNSKLRPDPGLLVKSMNEITAKGLLRQSVVPLLLQKHVISEDQILLLLNVMERLGFLSEVRPSDLLDDSSQAITVPEYPNLLYTRVYRLCLFLIPYANRPHIHWTIKPHKGDIQVNWGYLFPNGIPSGCIQRLVTLCHITSVKQRASYVHTWRSGVLCRVGEAYICIEEGDQGAVNVSCRTLADEPGEERTCVQYMWAQLAPFIYVTHQYLLTWNGLFCKQQLTCYGTALHGGVVILREKPIPLMKSIDLAQRGESFTFQDDGMSRYVDVPLLLPYDFSQFYDVFGWISYLVENRETVTSLIEDNNYDDRDFTLFTDNRGVIKMSTLRRQQSQGSNSNRKRDGHIKWSKNIHFIQPDDNDRNVDSELLSERVSDSDSNIVEMSGETTDSGHTSGHYICSPSPNNNALIQDHLEICSTSRQGNTSPTGYVFPNDLSLEMNADYRYLEGRYGWQVIKLCLQIIVDTQNSKHYFCDKREKHSQTDGITDLNMCCPLERTAAKLVTKVVIQASIKVTKERSITREKELRHKIEAEFHNAKMEDFNNETPHKQKKDSKNSYDETHDKQKKDSKNSYDETHDKQKKDSKNSYDETHDKQKKDSNNSYDETHDKQKKDSNNSYNETNDQQKKDSKLPNSLGCNHVQQFDRTTQTQHIGDIYSNKDNDVTPKYERTKVCCIL